LDVIGSKLSRAHEFENFDGRKQDFFTELPALELPVHLVGRDIQFEKPVVDVVGRIDFVIGDHTTLGVETLGTRLRLLLRGDHRKVSPAHLPSHLDAKQTGLVRVVAKQLTARQGQPHITGFDRLDDFVFVALVHQLDLGRVGPDLGAVVIDLYDDFFADGSRKVDLQLLLHVQGRKQGLAGDPFIGHEGVDDGAFTGDGDAFAAGDLDFRFLATTNDLFQGTRQFDGDRQVDQTVAVLAGLAGSRHIQVLVAGHKLVHRMSAGSPASQVVHENLHHRITHRSGRIVGKTARQSFRTWEQIEKTRVLELCHDAQRTVVLD